MCPPNLPTLLTHTLLDLLKPPHSESQQRAKNSYNYSLLELLCFLKMQEQEPTKVSTLILKVRTSQKTLISSDAKQTVCMYDAGIYSNTSVYAATYIIFTALT